VTTAQKIRVLALAVLSMCMSGCGDKFWDPTQLGRFRPVPAVNVVLDSLGVAEEIPSTWEGAEEPKPEDAVAYETDYVFGSGDIVRISIFELLDERTPFTQDYIVTETGKLSIPEVGIVNAAGLTESQLEDEIKQILSPSVLKAPSVTVALLESQQRMFSIWGNAVPLPGRYQIPRYDFRLTDALALGRVSTQFNVGYIYISRMVTAKDAAIEQTAPEPKQNKNGEQDDMLEIITPLSDRKGHGSSQGLVIASAEMVTDKELSETALPEGLELLPDEPADVSQASTRETIIEPVQPSRIEWIFQDGKWVPVDAGAEKQTETQAAKTAGESTGWKVMREKMPEGLKLEEMGLESVKGRVIKIPTDKLNGGDPRYNVIVRPGDSVNVPFDVLGEFYIMGNVNAQGVVPLTGRPITLKMAIATAGGLGPLAWPKNCEVIRRIGRQQEEVVMVDLDKIASGEQPDFFIKPNDLINVGTHPTARWRAVLRNAFRATYGFGFVYDRNFADRDFGTGRPFPPLNMDLW